MTLTVPAPSELAERGLGDASLAWADAGWHVFPIIPRGKTPYRTGEFCERTDDHACGFHCASTDREQLSDWWDAHPDSNIGVTHPTASPVDEDRIGVLAENDIHLPRCPWEVTGRAGGGRHFFVTAPADWPGLRGEDVKVNYRVPGVEVKGFNKGYLVVAPSIHASGNRYEVKAGGYVPEIPRPVLDRLVEVVEPLRGPEPLITVGADLYALPPSGYTGSRYEAILRYTAHLYNRGLATEEMWALVQVQLAPLFAERLSARDLRSRFNRATKDLVKSLGERRGLPSQDAPHGPLEDAPLTEFDSRPIGWLWPSWLPRGVVTLMDGNPGVSKSTVVADLVARITTGREWPDGSFASAGSRRVTWITTEDDPGRVLRPRIEAAGGDASLVRFVTSEVVLPGGGNAFREYVVARASEPLGLALVILDPLFSHIDAKVKSIADAEMRQNVMNPLGDAAEAADISILVVRHFNKDTTASAINRGAGSLGGIVGAARALWSVTVDPSDESGETKAIGVTKLNYARKPLPMRYQVVDRVPPGWGLGATVSAIDWIGPAPVSIDTMMSEPSDVGGAVETLRELLSDGPVEASAVAHMMRSRGYGRDATRGAKQRLGVVTAKKGMSGGWEWSLPVVAEESEESEESDDMGGTRLFEESEESGADSSDSSASRERARVRTNGPEPDSSDPSDSSKSRKSRVQGAPPAQARAREGEWLRPCRSYSAHQSSHRQTSAGYVCLACDQEDAE